MKRKNGFDFELKHLDLFLDVCQTGSMTEAAQRAGLTQPAVSHVISALEKTFGSPLFDRNLRPLQLTPAGRVLRTTAEQLIENARLMTANVRRAASRYPELRIGVVDSVVGIVARDLITFLEPVTQSLSIWAGLAPTQRDSFLDRRADIVVSSDPLADLDHIERYELVREPFVIVLPGSMETMASAPLSVLADHAPLIRYSIRSHIGQQIEQHLRRMRINPPRLFEVDVSEALLDTVRAGIGWTISTPLCLMSSIRQADNLVVAPLSPEQHRSIYLLARKGELGDLPKTVAARVSNSIRLKGLEGLFVKAPWLKARTKIADGTLSLADAER